MTGTNIAGRENLTWAKQASVLAPGTLLSLGTGAASFLVAFIVPLPSVLIALGLGIALSSIIRQGTFAPGAIFCSTFLLRVGVALLGLQIALAELAGGGVAPIVIPLGGVILIMLLGPRLGRWLGLRAAAATSTAASVAICGASAALAMASVMPKGSISDEEAVRIVAGVTVVGTAAMLLYPLLATLMNLSELDTGILLGASLHEVAQAVGAGFAVSESVGESATVVKLVRVACLPLVLLWAKLMFTAREGGSDRNNIRVPFFLIGFVMLLLLGNTGIVPANVVQIFSGTARFLLVVAIAALGMRISARQLVAGGTANLMMILPCSLLLLLFSVTALLVGRAL